MKKIITLLIVLICFQISYSGTPNKVSFRTQQLLTELKGEKEINNELIQEYQLLKIQGEWYVGALMLADGNVVLNLEGYKIKLGSSVNNVLSLKIPIAKLESFVAEGHFTYLEVDDKVLPKLDAARAATGVDVVHNGFGLPQAYKGQNVVIGIMDFGFDLTHPTFYDESGNTYRVKRVWHQGESGTPPSAFNYGSEFNNQTDILNEVYTENSGSHGTHVAGIAGGSGRGSNGKYEGVAPEADLVFVQLGGGASSTIDGINYIFSYAQLVGKPAVINMSLGKHLGPHDGSSLFDQALDGVVGGGKICVGAAGNEGDITLHLRRDFGNGATMTSTLVAFDNGNKIGTIDAWGAVGTDFCVSIDLVNNNGGTLNEIASTGFWCASENSPNTTYPLVNSNNDTCFVVIGTVSVTGYNQKPEIAIAIVNKTTDYIRLVVDGGLGSNNGIVDVWNHGTGTGAAFYDGGFSGVSSGDNNYTVGEIGGTANRIITVGAFTTKNNFQNISNVTQTRTEQIGAIAGFSSRGPTADGRTKPEITAPGNVIVSSVNSYDANFLPSGSSWDDAVESVTFGGTTWYWGAEQGTSMATPFTAGVIALMLQVNPNLTPEQAKQILKDNALTDSYTGTIPSNGSNIWGFGKIAAFDAIGSLTSINELNGNSKILMYPNPATSTITIVGDGKQMFSIIYDLAGREMSSNEMHEVMNNLDVSKLAKGMYVLKINEGEKQYQQRFVIQ